MGSLHISEIDIERYRERKLAPAELLAVNHHAFSCDICHQRLVGKGRVTGAYRFIKEELKAAVLEHEEHLRFEQVVAYATGQLDEADREILETHIEECPDCDSEIADIRLFNATAALRPPRGPAPAPEGKSLWVLPKLKPAHRIPLQIAAMVAIAILVVRVTTAPLSSKADRLTAEVGRLRSANDTLSAQLAQQPSNGQAIPSSRTGPENQGQSAPVATPVLPGGSPGITLRDGGRNVRLGDQGNLEADGLIPAQYLGLVATALKSGRLSVPGSLAGSSGSQTRSASEGDPFHLLAPVGITSMSDRPRFTWTPLADAESYSVDVRDLATDEETESDKLLKPEWTTERPFQRGHKYSWVVIATLNAGKHVYVPGTGSPSAVFAILPAVDVGDLQQAKAASKDSHLLLAVLYARRGLIIEAGSELKALSVENPHSEIVERLRKSLDNRHAVPDTKAHH
ncbi:MAG TPA: zf-HC2 domain-containing protein [Blastocatellia bacterium]